MKLLAFFLLPIICCTVIVASVIFFDAIIFDYGAYPEYIPENFRITSYDVYYKSKAIQIGIFMFYSTIFFSIYYTSAFFIKFLYNIYFDENQQNHRLRLKTIVNSKSLRDFLEKDDFNLIENKSFIEGRATGFSFNFIFILTSIFALSAWIFLGNIEYINDWEMFELAISIPHVISLFPLSFLLIFLSYIIKNTSWLDN